MALSDTLGGVAVDILADSAARSVGSNTSVRPIPGVSGAATGNAYVDLGGQTPRTLSYGIRADSYANWQALEALVGTSCTLSYADGTFTVILIELERKQRLPGGQQIGNAEFLVIA